MLRVQGAGDARSPRLLPSELQEKSGKSVGESRAASGKGPVERRLEAVGSILPAGFGFPGLVGAGREEKAGEKKDKNVEKKIKLFLSALSFPSLQPAA